MLHVPAVTGVKHRRLQQQRHALHSGIFCIAYSIGYCVTLDVLYRSHYA
jgi:hypothetical protein